MRTDERRQQLADFLRARRQSLQPEKLGLPQRKPRRTSGLTREEVAERAEISVDWYSWLEQGRNIKTSERTLSRIAAALELTPCQREYLFRLAREEPSLPPQPSGGLGNSLLQRMLDAQGNNPAYVHDGHFDILASNLAARRAFFDHLTLPIEERNFLWLLLTNPMIQQLIVDWEAKAQNLLAIFRANWSRAIDDRRFAKLIGTLEQLSSEFRASWVRHDVDGRISSCKTLDHPLAGRIELEPLALQVFGTSDLIFLVYLPMPGTDSATKLDALSSSEPIPIGASHLRITT
jgi:transcriptional regulator with XRE-family HTH domain